jgi:bacterioferritin (cytochrome b1)
MTSIDNVTILNQLLDDELNNPIRFLEESAPYLDPEYADLVPELRDMTKTRRRRASELAERIDALGGEPASLRPQREEQYLAFLSLKFLLPQLIEWKNRAILLHERALMLFESADDTASISAVEAHLQQHRTELDRLTH